MEEIIIQVKNDHLERMTKVKKPIIAIGELIWNALDADADLVKVSITENPIKGLDKITIEDNGHGINIDDAKEAFGSLGGSRKKLNNRSREKKRIVHGQAGKGRFRAFSIGEKVTWDTVYRVGELSHEYKIVGNYTNLGKFLLDDRKTARSQSTGTVVTIDNIQKDFRKLIGGDAVQEVTENFALYIREYPEVKIIYDGKRIDPGRIIDVEKTYNLAPINYKGKLYEVVLTIIEWKTATERSLALCCKKGIVLDKIKPGIQAPGFNFTAYLKSDLVRVKEGHLGLKELDPDFEKLISEAKQQMRDHFRNRQAEKASVLVESWKEDKVYPYEGEPVSIVEEAERKVFDICALNINEYLPGFDSSEIASKRFSFALIKQAIEQNPGSLRKILREVLNLPEDKQNDLADLLEKTTLSALVTASKTITDRLDFLKGLELILFDLESRERLLERSQLHRILADHTWIFGEEFNLSVDDESLTVVLKKHLDILGMERDQLDPVTKSDGSRGIVDLMLSRVIRNARADEHDHLIIELKRPSCKLGNKETNQIEDYAVAVACDERFHDTNTNWHFLLISNSMDETCHRKSHQPDRPSGLIYQQTNPKIYVWAKAWSQIIDGVTARLRFFEEKLNYNASRATGLEYLKKAHEKYLPLHLKN